MHWLLLVFLFSKAVPERDAVLDQRHLANTCYVSLIASGGKEGPGCSLCANNTHMELRASSTAPRAAAVLCWGSPRSRGCAAELLSTAELGWCCLLAVGIALQWNVSLLHCPFCCSSKWFRLTSSWLIISCHPKTERCSFCGASDLVWGLAVGFIKTICSSEHSGAGGIVTPLDKGCSEWSWLNLGAVTPVFVAARQLLSPVFTFGHCASPWTLDIKPEVKNTKRCAFGSVSLSGFLSPWVIYWYSLSSCWWQKMTDKLAFVFQIKHM